MQISDPNAYLFNFIQPNNKLIIANSVYSCDYVRSDNNGVSWSPLMNNNYYVNKIIRLHQNLYLLFNINYDLQKIKYVLTDSNFIEFKETQIGSIDKQLKNFFVCNDKYINVYLYADRNDTPFVDIYQSPINNISWNYVATIINDDINNAELSCFGGIPYYFKSGSPPLLLKSNDEGINWVEDHLLDDFQSVVFIKFNLSGKIFVSGTHKTEGLNLYESNGLEPFKPVSNFWKDYYLGLNADHYPFLIGLNNEKGLFISHDAGINWINITGNLPFQYQNKEAILYGGNILKKDGKLLQNIIHHGLYEMEDPLPVFTIDQLKENTFDLFPIPCTDYLLIKSQNFILLDSKIIIYDPQGRKLLINKIYSGNIIELDMTKLQSGIYFIEIIDSNSNTYKGKFVKS